MTSLEVYIGSSRTKISLIIVHVLYSVKSSFFMADCDCLVSTLLVFIGTLSDVCYYHALFIYLG